MTSRLWYAYAAAIGAAAAILVAGTVWFVATLPSPRAGGAEVVTILAGALATLVLARVSIAFHQRGKAADERPGGAE
ncbi:hypothetical protein [Streptomyces sp.]|uniref:hypothetical protein n=1 Tax=Streptomyces sp. TaxID=1931 RepID=UPI002F92D6A4